MRDLYRKAFAASYGAALIIREEPDDAARYAGFFCCDANFRRGADAESNWKYGGWLVFDDGFCDCWAL